ncbi:hypothetical protein M2451_002535 [Dysgonomonas sp. PFB1-18]|nr:hypothetical protein [Dysgonomonas sp. PF1-14]MDH6339555.1 hypothetical protein [Dysgonomonas sp. PF1-16]MDH6381206.1 hypothetical protein [Dysgonomonas sp. PFB1-18]MDH6398418.1 hypothetical protein [Dysgonomonas sp. PF1-23]
MAKKQLVNEVKVKCVDCIFCPGEPVNHLVDCTNKNANPGGHKKGCWAHVCRHFKNK